MSNDIPPTSPSKSYTDEIRPSLGTGDLIFLHSTSPAGVMIEKLESKLGLPAYSHVGMVINDSGNLYLWDAPGGGYCFPDPYVQDPDNRLNGQDATHTGCRVSQLDDVLAYYVPLCDVKGFWYRKLDAPVVSERFGALRAFINRVDGLPFPHGPGSDDPTKEESGIAASYLAGQTGSSVLYGTYFCAHLVADSYMHMGLLEMEGYPPNGYSPAAFDESGTPRLPLVKTAALEKTIFVDWDWTQPTNAPTKCDQ